MIRVRCGRCQTEFVVPGPGRHTCPACGAVNELRATGAEPAFQAPPMQPPPSAPSPKVQCPSCGFRFIVGDIDVAKCPNCGTDVPVGGDRDPS